MSSLDLVHDEAALSAAHVPQVFTHKTNPSEVLLTGWCRTGPDAFAVTARWPRAHGFYVHRDGLLDPLLLSESIRQTLPLLSHAEYGVPLDHHLLWQDFRWELDPAAARDEGHGADVELRITATDVKYRGTRAAALVLHVEAWRQGARLAEARTHFTVQDPAVYRRLRGRYADLVLANARALPAPPPAPAPVRGGRHDEDVVLARADGEGRWQLRVDTSHPILFDHPVDHAPGMLLLEAARQAAQASSPRPTAVVGMEAVFTRYAELDAPCWIDARPLPGAPTGRQRILVTARQHDEEIFTDVVTLGEV
ncbi:ScbA/BarX family gamma-butyrolactone biosynthesis protein [Streptomyces nymphaeiformis]|uniref:A-factor biosynthesis hotdog domain-containing protein n=1 Tax=Streptomyces nymphaeiformis TaxID=2663842 RepID=A0A7W7XB34_9ACTN|nr:ScbA/BarX family gamma-butyrolactone biosynthesis protein [Streptomyces nymphaeiformis]MBB4980986.1 hypothetical protein [Streptomyces nymphaeiformis]